MYVDAYSFLRSICNDVPSQENDRPCDNEELDTKKEVEDCGKADGEKIERK